MNIMNKYNFMLIWNQKNYWWHDPSFFSCSSLFSVWLHLHCLLLVSIYYVFFLTFYLYFSFFFFLYFVLFLIIINPLVHIIVSLLMIPMHCYFFIWFYHQFLVNSLLKALWILYFVKFLLFSPILVFCYSYFWI